MGRLNDGRTSIDVSVNKTLTAADQGIVQRAVVDGLVFTLPATAAGLEFTIVNAGAPIANSTPGTAFDGSAGVNITPQAADGVSGLGFTATVSKGAVSAKATSIINDEIRLAASGVAGVTAWNVQSSKGIWTRQP